MKKLLLILTLGLGLCVFTDRASAEEPSTQEIQIRESTIPTRPVRPRSLQTFTQARIDYAVGIIEVAFNYPLGDIRITLSDAADCPQHTQYVDTDSTPFVRLPLPAAGVYRLTLEGDDYLAEGDFAIE